MLIKENNNTVVTVSPTTEPRNTVPAVVYKNIEHASMNYPVLSVVCGVFLLYVLGLLWIKRIRSKEQVHIGATIIPHRSFYRHPHHYFLLFYTGSGRHAGSTANVYCVIHGKKKKTKPIVLRDPERLLFQSGTTSSFLLTLNKSLDQISKLHLWHDISGPKPSWFLEKVVVYHLNTGLLWNFEAHRWLDVSENDGSVECVLHAIPRSEFLRKKTLFEQMFSKGFTNNHIWLSPFFLKSRTMFSRVERFTSCLAVTMVTLLAVTVAVDSKKDGDVFPNMKINLGPMAFQLSDIIWGAVCSVIPFCFRLLLELLFTYSDSTFKQLSPDERDVKTHIDWCLSKANEITFLDGQSNSIDVEKENNDDLENAEEEKETQIRENGSLRMRQDSLQCDSDWEYMAGSWSDVSLRNIGLEFTNQDCVSENMNGNERMGSELHDGTKPDSTLDGDSDTAIKGALENQDEFKEDISPSVSANDGSSVTEDDKNESSPTTDTEYDHRDDVRLIKEGSHATATDVSQTSVESNHQPTEKLHEQKNSQEPIISNGGCMKEVLEDSGSFFEDGRMPTSSKKNRNGC